MARKKIVDQNGQVYVQKKGGCLRLILLAIIGIVILAGIGSMMDKKDNRTATPSSNQQVAQDNAAQEVIIVSATDVIQTFEDNEVKGKETYTGKRARITGTVGSVGESFGKTYVTLTNDNNQFSVISLQAYFDDTTGLSDLAKGQTITIEGTIGEQSLNIAVNDCVLVE